MQAVVVSFDHLPVGFLGCYGNTWVDTPTFDRLAAEGVTFDRHFAERVGRGVERHAWWTGRRTVGTDLEVGAGESIAAQLGAAGVRTTLIVEGPSDPHRATPRPEGFGEVIDVTGEEGLEVVPAETPFSQAVLRGAEWLEAAPAGDWLLWVKSRGVPAPWVPPREFAERYVPLFEELEDDPDWDAEQAADDEFEWLVPEAEEEEEVEADREEGRDDEAARDPLDEELEVEEEAWDLDEAEEFDQLLTMLGAVGLRGSTRGLETADWLLVRAVYGGYVALLDEGLRELRRAIEESVGEDVLLIVTAGEGESLGERAELPGVWAALGEEVVHTPLLVTGPGIQTGSRLGELVQTLDVGPTLLEWFGVEATGGNCDGRSFLPCARGDSSPEREELVLGRGDDFIGLRTPEWYLVARDSPPKGVRQWLFAKPEDVWDVQDVAQQEPETTERLAERLRMIVAGNSVAGSERGGEIGEVGTSPS